MAAALRFGDPNQALGHDLDLMPGPAADAGAGQFRAMHLRDRLLDDRSGLQRGSPARARPCRSGTGNRHAPRGRVRRDGLATTSAQPSGPNDARTSTSVHCRHSRMPRQQDRFDATAGLPNVGDEGATVRAAIRHLEDHLHGAAAAGERPRSAARPHRPHRCRTPPDRRSGRPVPRSAPAGPRRTRTAADVARQGV